MNRQTRELTSLVRTLSEKIPRITEKRMAITLIKQELQVILLLMNDWKKLIQTCSKH